MPLKVNILFVFFFNISFIQQNCNLSISNLKATTIRNNIWYSYNCKIIYNCIIFIHLDYKMK